MKSEPSTYSIDDLSRDKKTFWEGVRNFQARNNIKNMKKGDLVFFYHSVSNPTGVAGIAKVAREAYPDHTQFDKNSDYFDPKSTKENPTWQMVDVEFVEKLPRIVTLDEIKKDPRCKDMVLVNNSRLSVQPVTKEEFEQIISLQL